MSSIFFSKMELADAHSQSHCPFCHCNPADRPTAELAQEVQCIKSQIFQAHVELFPGQNATVPPAVGARAAISVASSARACAPPRVPSALPAPRVRAWHAPTFQPISRLTGKLEGLNALLEDACISSLARYCHRASLHSLLHLMRSCWRTKSQHTSCLLNHHI